MTPTVADAADLDAFCAATWPAMRSFHLHRCGGRLHRAEDLAQETFVAVVSELRRGRQVTAPVPWVFGIARHKLHDHYRAERAVARWVAPAEEAEQLADLRRTETTVELRSLVLQALSAVAPQQRAALLLCYVEGLTMAEAARFLNKTPEAVESLLARGRRSFRTAYEKAVA